MSKKSIDQRVVEMRFENQQFEHGAKETMTTIDKLKEKLKIGSGKDAGMDELNSSLNGIKSGFSALSEVAVGALRHIGEKAVDVGLQMTKSLSIAPMMDGFREYELEMDSIQTILTNTEKKGTTLDDVNKALAELNEYADLTVYNFADMTSAIGRFTAAGVGLEDSVNAIKGFSNLAAGTGTKNADLVRAEIQLAQALGNSTMTLMDWRSMMNAGGIGGQYFQDALIQTAKELHGRDEDVMMVVKQLEEGSLSFYNSLSKKDSPFADWLSIDIVTETLKKFADDPSLIKAATQVKTVTQLFDTLKEAVGTGWADSFRIVIGDMGEATEVLTKISDALGGENGVITKMADSRNAMLQEWKDLGGRDDLIKSMENAWKALLSIAKPIKEAFADIFPPLTGKTLADLTAKLKDFTAGLKLSDSGAEKLKNVIKALLTPVKMVIDTFKGGTTILSPFVAALGKVGSAVLGFIATLLKLPDTFAKAIGNDKYNKLINGLSKAFENLWTIVKTVSGGIAQGFGKIFDAFNIDLSSDKLNSFANTIADKLIGLFDKLSNLKLPDNIFKNIGNSFEELVKKFKGIKLDGSDFATQLKKAVEGFDVLKQINAADTFDQATNKVKTFFGTITGFISNLNIVERLGAAFKFLGEAFGSFISHLDTGRAIAMAYGASLSIFLLRLSSLFGTFMDIGKSLSNLTKSLSSFLKACAHEKNAAALLKLAGAIGVIAASIIALSFVPQDGLTKALTAIGIISAIVAAFLLLQTVLDKIKDSGGDDDDDNNPIKSILSPIADGINGFLEDAGKALKRAALLPFAAGVTLIVFSMGKLISAIEQIKDLNIDVIKDNIWKYGVVITALFGLAKLGQIGGMGTLGLAVGIVGLAFFVKTLLKVAEDAGKADINIKGALLTVGGLTAVTIALSTLMESSKYTTGHMMAFGGGMLLIAGAIAILIKSAKSLSELGFIDYGKAILVIGGISFLLSELMNASSLTASAKAGTIVALGAAIAVLAGSLAVLSLIKPGPLISAALALGGTMAALGLLLKWMQSINRNTFADTLQTLIPAITMLSGVTVALAVLSGYDWKSLLASAGSIGLVLTALVGGLKILNGIGSITLQAVGTAAALTGLTVALAAIIKWLAAVPATQALGSATALSELLLALTASVKILSIANNITLGAVASVGVLTGITAGLAAIIKWLAEVPIQNALGAATSLGILLLALVGADGAITLISTIQGNLKNALASIGTLTLVTAGLGWILQWLADNSNVGQYLNIAKSLTLLILGLSGACLILGAVGLFGDKAIEGVGVFDALLGSILGTIGLLAAIGELIDKIGGEGKFVSLITRVGEAIGSFFGAIQGTFYSESFSRISETMDLTPLEKVFDFIKSFDDAVYDNLRKFAEALEVVVTNGLFTNLSAFGEAMSDFSVKLSGMDPEVVTKSQNAVKAIACFATAEVDYGLIKNSAFVSSEFNDALVYFGAHFKLYANHIKDIDAAIVTKSTNVAKSVKSFFENLPQNSDMVKQIAKGGSQLSNIGSELKKFGASFKAYANYMSKIDVSGLNKTTSALKKLLDVLDSHKNVKTDSASSGLNVIKGLIKGLVDGSADLRKASEKVVKENITDAMNEELGIHSPGEDGQNTTNSHIDGLELPFGERADELKGVVENFMEEGFDGGTDNALELMSGKYEEIVTKTIEQYKDYGSKIPDSISKGISDNGGKVTDAINTLSQNGIDVFSGYNDQYSKIYDGITKEVQESMKKDLKAYSEQSKASIGEHNNTMKTMSQNGIDIVSDYNQEYAKLYEDMDKQVQDSLTKELDNFNIQTQTGLDGHVETISSYNEPCYNAGAELGNSTSNGLVSSYGNIKQAVTDIGEQSVQTFYPYSDEFYNNGLDTGQKLANAFREKVPEIKQSVEEFGSGMHTSIELYAGKIDKTAHTTSDSFVEMLDKLDKKNKERIGKIKDTTVSELDNEKYRKALNTTGIHVVDGFVSGLSSDSAITKVAKAARELAQSVINGIKDKLNISSPSKETEQLGSYAIDGLVNGLTKFSGRVVEASEAVGNTTLDSMNDIISKIAEKIDSDVALDPVIRPVLDWSNVEENAGMLNSMLGNETFKMARSNEMAISVNRELSNLNSNNLSINDTGIISAIDQLHVDIADLNARMANMQVVMDSGALVGQLFAPMDTAFGTRIHRNLREREA